MACQPSTKIFKMSPVISIESVSDLWAHVTQEEGLIHRVLGPFGISRRHLMTPIIPRSGVVAEFGPENLGYCRVLGEVRMTPICLILRE